MAVLAQEVTTVDCTAASTLVTGEYFLLYGMRSDFEQNDYHPYAESQL